MDENLPATPCGLIAKSFFNDTYELWKVNDDTENENITIDDSEIAWETDR